MIKNKYFLLACLFPILILLGMSYKPIMTQLSGDIIHLETKPVDPRDLFRGDYVILSYKIEEISSTLYDEKLKSSLDDKGYHAFRNEKVYVSLVEKDGVHEPIFVSFTKPKNDLYISGKIRYISGDNNNSSVYIDYSLDKFFLEENTGLQWEDASRKGDIIAVAKVKNGYAVLTDIRKK